MRFCVGVDQNTCQISLKSDRAQDIAYGENGNVWTGSIPKAFQHIINICIDTEEFIAASAPCEVPHHAVTTIVYGKAVAVTVIESGKIPPIGNQIRAAIFTAVTQKRHHLETGQLSAMDNDCVLVDPICRRRREMECFILRTRLIVVISERYQKRSGIQGIHHVPP